MPHSLGYGSSEVLVGMCGSFVLELPFPGADGAPVDGPWDNDDG